MAASFRPRLCLHFDVNQTILAGDPAGSLSVPEALNKAIAHFAIIEPQALELSSSKSEVDWRWHDGQSLGGGEATGSYPPLFDGDRRLTATQRRFSDQFRQHGREFCRSEWGRLYRPLFTQLARALEWPESEPAVEHLTAEYKGKEGEEDWFGRQEPYRYHFLIPAFFQTLATLHQEHWDFRIFLRTMGTDLPHLVGALDAFSRGRHPRWPHIGTEEQPAAWAQMSALPGETHYELKKPSQPSASVTASLHPVTRQAVDDDELIHFFEETQEHLFESKVIGVQDDYHAWKNANYSPTAGKPVWYTHQKRHEVVHLFFDDNIHHNADDSIVSLRTRVSPEEPFRILSGEEALQYHDMLLIKVSIAEALLDPDYFLKKIHSALERIQNFPFPSRL